MVQLKMNIYICRHIVIAEIDSFAMPLVIGKFGDLWLTFTHPYMFITCVYAIHDILVINACVILISLIKVFTLACFILFIILPMLGISSETYACYLRLKSSVEEDAVRLQPGSSEVHVL